MAERIRNMPVTDAIQRSLFGFANIKTPEAYRTWLSEADMLTIAEGIASEMKVAASMKVPVKLYKHPIRNAVDNLISLLKRAS